MLLLAPYNTEELEEESLNEESSSEETSAEESATTADPSVGGAQAPTFFEPTTHVEPPRKALPTILVVEDDDYARRELTELLNEEGYQVQPVASGEGAVSAMQRPGVEIGTILMDLKMPGKLDGIDAAHYIQKVMHRDIPIIFITAFYTMRRYHERVKEAKIEVVAWIDKPIDVDKLLGLLRASERDYAIRLVREAYHEWSSSRSTAMIQECVAKLPPELIARVLDAIKEEKQIFSDFTAQVNFASYEHQKPSLLEKYPNNYVAFLDGALVRDGEQVLHDEDEDALIRAVYVKTGRSDMFVTKVSRDQKVLKLRRPRKSSPPE